MITDSDPNGPSDWTTPDMQRHRHTCLWRFLSLFMRKRKAVLIPVYLVTEMFPMYMESDLVMWDIFRQVVQENLMAPITLVEEKNAVRLFCHA